MPKRTHETNAERQRAYRERQQGERVGPPPMAVNKLPRTSRPARIRALARKVEEIAEEYRSWLDSVPENLAEAPLAQSLEEAIAQLDEAAGILEAIDPPRIR